MLKLYEPLVSEIALRTDNIKVGQYTILIYDKTIENDHSQRLLLIYDLPFVPRPRGRYISSLLSIALRCRVTTCNISSLSFPLEFVKTQPVHVDQLCRKRFTQLYLQSKYIQSDEEAGRLAVFRRLFETMESSYKADDKLVITNSIEQYHLSQLLKEENLSLAYALLVVSLETMANHKPFLSLEESWNNYGPRADWDNFFESEGLDANLASKIRHKLLKSDVSSSQRKFTRFVVNNLPSSFWETDRHLYRLDPHAINDIQVFRDNQEKILKNLYTIRSNLFHSGAGIQVEPAMYHRDRLISKSNFLDAQRLLDGESIESVEMEPSPDVPLIPNYSLFEHIVHDCILHFLKVIG